MLCLDRRIGESIVILVEGKQITVRLMKRTGHNKFQVGVEAPKDVAILRAELLARKDASE